MFKLIACLAALAGSHNPDARLLPPTGAIGACPSSYSALLEPQVLSPYNTLVLPSGIAATVADTVCAHSTPAPSGTLNLNKTGFVSFEWDTALKNINRMVNLDKAKENRDYYVQPLLAFYYLIKNYYNDSCPVALGMYAPSIARITQYSLQPAGSPYMDLTIPLPRAIHAAAYAMLNATAPEILGHPFSLGHNLQWINYPSDPTKEDSPAITYLEAMATDELNLYFTILQELLVRVVHRLGCDTLRADQTHTSLKAEL